MYVLVTAELNEGIGDAAEKCCIQKGGGASGTDVPSPPCKRKGRARGGRVLVSRHREPRRQGQL